MLHTLRMTRGPSATRTRQAQQPPPPNPRRRWRFIGVALAAVLVMSAAGFVYLTRGPSDVTVDQAVKDYRAQAATASNPAEAPAPAKSATVKSSAAPAQSSARAHAGTARAIVAKTGGPMAYPAPGVYAYATRGYE